MTKSQKDEWINNHGNRVCFSEGYDPNLGLGLEPGTWWHKTGNKTLKELGKQEKRMTREEAIKITSKYVYGSAAVGHVDLLVELGILKIETPKSVREQAVAKLNNRGWYGEFIVAALEQNGFKVVKDLAFSPSPGLCNNS